MEGGSDWDQHSGGVIVMTRGSEIECGALPDGLFLFDLPQPRTGFHHFVSSWFFVDPAGRRIVVDPGPANTIPLLLKELSSVTDGVDIVLLTHIHLDHSGGISQFCEQYPNAKVVVHGKARRHLIDPGRLWRSSLEVLGRLAEMYGAPRPLDPKFLAEPGEITGVTIIETPGHSPHHLSFVVPLAEKKLFFIGEAAGMHIPMTPSDDLPYLRPTSPPKFDGDAARESIHKLEDALKGDELLCYSHWGLAHDPKNMISLSSRQLDEWISIISEMRDKPMETIADYLISHDPLMGGYAKLPEDLRKRERIFILNSATGILKHIGQC
jgi:glyoxylase-like metal-dependent hydrolase (beta-lactamase superfamily II)